LSGSEWLVALNQLQHFRDEFSPPILSNQIPEFLVSVRAFRLPVEPIQMVNGCKVGLEIFQSTHALVISISVPNVGAAPDELMGHDSLGTDDWPARLTAFRRIEFGSAEGCLVRMHSIYRGAVIDPLSACHRMQDFAKVAQSFQSIPHRKTIIILLQ
jgi:hypothetical protein